ncbi:MAG: family 1 glycosylhydrolase [Microcella sp.]|uniref:family 1 glycosylhydrolase n=1 Tax=Microcella sp. TaxID=1913979 RepID=UPI003314619C
MNLFLDLDFGRRFAPEEFFFGVANAPYLCEGGYNTEHGPKNNYGYREADGRVPVSGETTRFWENYREHIELAANIGMTAFRTGVDWARVQPTLVLAPGEAPAWDESALDHYADILRCVIDHGMEPIVTLHHFANPAWLGDTLWTREESSSALSGYQAEVAGQLGRRLASTGHAPIGHFVTVNELNLISLRYYREDRINEKAGAIAKNLFALAADNILTAHVLCYDAIKALYEVEGWVEPRIGFGTASQSSYEHDKMMLDIVRLRTEGVERQAASDFLKVRKEQWRRRLDSLARRHLDDAQSDSYFALANDAALSIEVSDLTRTLDSIYASSRDSKIDFISANIYEPFEIARLYGDVSLGVPWWELTVDGDIYSTMIHAYNDGNDGLPMYMGENSIAYEQAPNEPAVPRPDGWTRERYLKTYLMEMIKCMAQGVPIRGYLYWSLVDDFEWHAGFTPRLGLYNYDYRTHTIMPTDGLGEDAGDTYRQLVAALRSGDSQTIQDVFVRSLAVWSGESHAH